MIEPQPAAAVPPASQIEITAPITPEFAEILTQEALGFIETLVREFGPTRDDLLSRRAERQARIDAGELATFVPETREVREAEWLISLEPADLQDRRVEITGHPSDRKMVINALNSGARVFMADFEDALLSTWENVIG